MVESVYFKDGSFVKKGDPLFKIDVRPYEALMEMAKATLASDQADLALKALIVERDKPLVASGSLPQQTYAQYLTDQAVVTARIELDKAQLNANQLNIDFCSIASPIDGIAGHRQIDPGNIVPANIGPVLVNIKSIDPLYVSFTIPERYLLVLRESMKERSLKVKITIDQSGIGEDVTTEGELDFVENAVDAKSGTVFLRASVPNPERRLWGGQFVRIRLDFQIRKGTLLAPERAVIAGKNGSYLYKIENGKAKRIAVATWLREEGYVIIQEGDVKPGDFVVTVGAMALRTDSQVKILGHDGTSPRPEVRKHAAPWASVITGK